MLDLGLLILNSSFLPLGLSHITTPGICLLTVFKVLLELSMRWLPLQFFCFLVFNAGLTLILDVLGSTFLCHFCFIKLTYFCRVAAAAAAATAITAVIIFMQGICSYIPEKNQVFRVYSAAAVLYLQFVLHMMLFHMLNMFCTFTLALSEVYVRCPVWLFFCSSLILCFPGMWLRYCLNDFQMVPVSSIITGITFTCSVYIH